MKPIYILSCFLFLLSFESFAQTVVSQRTSDLKNERYVISGDAFLETLDNGVNRLRLSEDYDTAWGPDVRILLNNSVSGFGGFEVVNLTTINHFNGALTVDLPEGINIEDYNFVVFFCVTFNQLWASGQFGEVVGNSNSTCKTSSVFGATGVSGTDICPSDGTSDSVSFANSLNIPAGDEYVYLITDENEIVSEIITQDFYDFEGSGPATNRVYGMNYSGTLDMQIGQHRFATQASGCFEHSDMNDFLTITKDGCGSDFECVETLTATTDWAGSVEICPSDGSSDFVELRNNQLIEAGSNYMYLITDANEILQEVTSSELFDFEGSGPGEQRVYGIHFDGTLNPRIGQNRLNTTATGCFTHSGANLFLTIEKTACASDFTCEESLTATTDWATSVDICPNDGVTDFVELRNNLFIDAGDHYAYLITDAQGILQEVSTAQEFNFEGSPEAEQRVYGIHFDGILNPQIGQDRRMTTASGCFQHSGDNLFLTINKTGCPYECVETLTATHNWVTDIDICANDGLNDEIFLQNNLMISPGSNYVFLLTDANEILQEVITDSIYNFENTSLEEQRVYGMSYAGELDAKIGENRKMTSADECFIHSGDDLFITINKTAACNTTSTVDAQLAKQINVFPNPSNGVINIDLNALDVQFDQVTLFDITGRKVRDIQNLNNIQIEQAGVYLIQFSNSEVSTTKKIIIQ